jgi:hypothetical protein
MYTPVLSKADCRQLLHRVIVRLLVISIETGTATTALATTQLIYYLHDVNSSNVLIIVSPFTYFIIHYGTTA